MKLILQFLYRIHLNYSLFLNIKQRSLVVVYRRFGATYRSNPQGSGLDQ